MPAAVAAPPAPESTASAYAEALLRQLAVTPAPALQAEREHPAVGWTASGLMALTGAAAGPPRAGRAGRSARPPPARRARRHARPAPRRRRVPRRRLPPLRRGGRQP